MSNGAQPIFTLRYSLFLLVIGLITFCAMEVATRAFIVKVQEYVPSANPLLIYELNPDYPGINAAGMRQEEVDFSALDDYFVIAVIGDSHAYSMESEDPANSFPARLEHHAARVEGKKVKVLNFGVPGYDMLQELEVLRSKALPLEVDAVVLQYCINDEHIANYIHPEHPWLNWLFYRSELLAGVWKRLIYSSLGTRYILPSIEDHFPDLLLYRPGLVGTLRARDTDAAHSPHPPRTKDRVPERYHAFIGRENFEKNVQLFGALAREAGVPVLATGFIEDRDRGLYEESGFLVYSFLDIFRGLDMRDFGYDPSITADHFSDRGSDFIGKALADFVAANSGVLLTRRAPSQPQAPLGRAL
jgi:hypothetical protein